MNDLINEFLSARDKIMPDKHLWQPGFMSSTCGPFTKNKERINKFKETRGSRYIYQNKLDKTYFQNGMAYGDCKDLPKRTASDNVLRAKTFDVPNNPKCDGY